MERKNNGIFYKSPKKCEKYEEEQPDFIGVSEDIIQLLSELSEELYNNENVFSCTITFVNGIGFDIFIDDESRIIQYIKNIWYI